MKKQFPAIAIIAVALIGIGVWFFGSSPVEPDDANTVPVPNESENGTIADLNGTKLRVSPNEDIRITYPVNTEEDLVQIPALVEGGARPIGSALEVAIFDAQRNLLGSKRFAPDEDPEVSEEGFGVFSVRVPYDLPPTKQGFIQYITIDPETEEEQDKLFYPITFTADPAFVDVYFTGDQAEACTAIPTSRLIVESQVKIGILMNMLLDGPTEEEQRDGFGTAFPEGTKVNFWNLNGESKQIRIDFNENLRAIAGSCNVLAARMQLEKTIVEQFPEVESMRITINDDDVDVLEP